ncbi:MAG: PilN domain-containing protein [Marinobacterium sp.]|nr:PilN domain-containing protein [Marinobacterium sp.]
MLPGTNLFPENIRGICTDGRESFKQFWYWWSRQLLPRGLWQYLDRSTQSGFLLLSRTQTLWLGQQLDSPSSSTRLPDPQTAENTSLPTPVLQQLQQGKPPVILLDDSLILEVPLQLPVAARAYLKQVVERQLPKLTPFQADQVYYCYQQKRIENQLQITVWLVPRQLLAPRLAQLEAFGLKATIIRPARQARLHNCNLMPEPPARKNITRLFNKLLLTGNIVLIIALLILPLWQRQQQIQSLTQQRNQLRTQAEQVHQTRQQINQLVQLQQQLKSLQQIPAHLPVLTQLTRLLPDTVWLSQLHWRAGQLTLEGEAPTASWLIGQLDNQPEFSNVRFITPVIRNRNNGNERFSIKMSLHNQRSAVPQPDTPPKPVKASPQTISPQPTPPLDDNAPLNDLQRSVQHD